MTKPGWTASAALAALSLVFLSTACGGGGDECNALERTGCDGAQVCEIVDDGSAACFDPVVIRGGVFDLADQGPLGDARVIALDPNSAPISSVAISEGDGSYELTVSVVRTGDGTPVAGQGVTLRADRAGYQSFPGGVRQALPIDVSSPTPDGGRLVVESGITDIGLNALEVSSPGSIGGNIDIAANSRGALVVAELGGIGISVVTDQTGDYRIFNVPDGVYSVTAYSQGVNYEIQEVTVASSNETANLGILDENTATVSGKVEIVNPGAGSGTSVIMVVQSTFNAALARGETPPGLRVPGGTALDITGDFTFEGVPAGTYAVLAAFENDSLVRDPDSCIGGTDIVTQTVDAGATIDIADGFKVTGALDIVSPGANGPELVANATPTFTWVDDSSEATYDIVVLDAFGATVHTATIPGVNGGANAEYTYDGPALTSGEFYQYRVTSVRNNDCEASQTEDLKGVFIVP